MTKRKTKPAPAPDPVIVPSEITTSFEQSVTVRFTESHTERSGSLLILSGYPNKVTLHKSSDNDKWHVSAGAYMSVGAAMMTAKEAEEFFEAALFAIRSAGRLA